LLLSKRNNIFWVSYVFFRKKILLRISMCCITQVNVITPNVEILPTSWTLSERRKKITLNDLDSAEAIYEKSCYFKTTSYKVSIIQSKYMLHCNNMATTVRIRKTTWTNITHSHLRNIDIVFPGAISANITTLIQLILIFAKNKISWI